MADKVTCLNKNCAITRDEERMLSCWLCHGVCHFKCSGLSTLVAEALQHTNGLSWCCNDCRKIGVEYYRFFQSTKNTFINIQHKVAALSNEISSYGNLFDEFKQLNSLNSPPQSSPKRRKSARTKKNDKNSRSPIPSSSNSVPSGINTPVSSLNPQTTSATTTNLGLTSNSQTSSAMFSSTSLQNSSIPSITPQFSSAVTDNLTSKPFPNNSTNLPIAENIDNQGLGLPIDNDASSGQQVTLHNGPEGNERRELKLIPPNKSIFISRFASETTVDDIIWYLKTKIEDVADIQIHKFSYSQPRIITSFKLTVPHHLYEQILDTNFWPSNTLIREFEYKVIPRRKNIVRVHSRHQSNDNTKNNDIPKN